MLTGKKKQTEKQTFLAVGEVDMGGMKPAQGKQGHLSLVSRWEWEFDSWRTRTQECIHPQPGRDPEELTDHTAQEGDLQVVCVGEAVGTQKKREVQSQVTPSSTVRAGI